MLGFLFDFLSLKLALMFLKVITLLFLMLLVLSKGRAV
jgi:hypothetical protein